MKITRKSAATGVERTLDLDISSEQALRINDGEFIQDVLPHLTPSEREFILTGITDDEWDKLFKEDE